jgi:cyclopropane fatty-acyl-phospholipid synthase-like methyltransferase
VGERYIGVNPNVHLLLYKEDIKRFFKDWNGQKFDLIYNIGLADYLPDRVLKSFMQEAINALNDNGKFVLAHKDYLKFPHVYTSWIYDWNFIHRSLSDYNEFIQNHLTGFDQYNVFFESANQIIYFGEFSSRS